MEWRKFILMMALGSVVFFFARCLPDPVAPDPRGPSYAGSGECVRCHKSLSDSYAHTAHFLSTRLADETTVAGNFTRGSNELLINDTTRIMMEKRDSGLYQVLYEKNKQESAHRFDLVMGAVKGQTYIYWQNNGFFQLPVSYFTALREWTSSPGYSFANLHFNRPVVAACFECHSSFVNSPSDGLSKDQNGQKAFVLNIDCERCHGPAAAHVQFHDAHPDVKQSRYLVSFQSLGRAQKMDLCSACHSGTRQLTIKSTFQFKMGEPLTSYRIPVPDEHQELDVHGNQTQFLEQSKCFKMSELQCVSCHNTHVDQRSIAKFFNERCQTCHSPGNHFCKLVTDSNRVILQNNCTGCHMPAQASRVIVVQTAKNTRTIPTLVVNHRIAIYPEQTAKFLK